MAKDRYQLNINIDPELLLQLKSQAIREGKTLTQYVTEQLKQDPKIVKEDVLEERLLRIEKNLGLTNSSLKKENNIGVIFTEEGAKNYGDVAKSLFELHMKARGLSLEDGLKELSVYLHRHEHSNPELVFQILLGTHQLSGLEMTKAYRKGSCAMRTALSDWIDDPLEPLNDAFLSAVITKSLA